VFAVNPTAKRSRAIGAITVRSISGGVDAVVTGNVPKAV
jgi:hypothetical protein